MNKISLLALMLTLPLSGCNVVLLVLSKKPLGDKPLKVDPKNWQGNWVTNEGFVSIRVTDGATGSLQLTWTAEDPNSKPQLKTVSAQLRQSGDWTFLNIKGDQVDDDGKEGDDPKKDYFVWARVKRDGEFFIAWAPEKKAFEELVKNGVLPGEIKDNAVILDSLDPEKTSNLKNHADCSLFRWEHPMVFFRVSSEK